MADRLELLGRRHCHLCERARAMVGPLAQAAGIGVSEYDVDEDPDLVAEFGLRVPVLRFRGRVLAEGRFDPNQLRRLIGELPAPRSAR